MKQLFLSTLLSLLTLPLIAQEKWMADNAHSNLRFEVGWQDFSMRTGEFKTFDGSITTDSWKDLSKANVEFIVDATSVDLIAEKLENHAMSAEFLDVENYPEIIFKAESMRSTSDSTYVSNGKLTICGVEKDQDAEVEVTGYKESDRGNILGIKVTLNVARSKFGLNWGSPRLADNIKLVGHLLFTPADEEE